MNSPGTTIRGQRHDVLRFIPPNVMPGKLGNGLSVPGLRNETDTRFLSLLSVIPDNALLGNEVSNFVVVDEVGLVIG